MKITHDSYYTIGSTHQYCQDYADSGEKDSFVYACISDGCSSSKDSDIGARWLCKNFLKSYIGSYWVEANLVDSIRYGETMFEKSCFDATLLGLVYDKMTDQLSIYAWGDGQIYLKYKDGRTVKYSITYKSNAPYYLSYLLNNKTEQYEKEFGIEYAEIKETINDAETEFGLLRQRNFFKVIENASKTLDLAAVMSDGVESFMFPLSLNKQIVQSEFLNFKSMNGEFVKRRFQGFRRFCAKESVNHHDDLSLAAINFQN